MNSLDDLYDLLDLSDVLPAEDVYQEKPQFVKIFLLLISLLPNIPHHLDLVCV